MFFFILLLKNCLFFREVQFLETLFYQSIKLLRLTQSLPRKLIKINFRWNDLNNLLLQIYVSMYEKFTKICMTISWTHTVEYWRWRPICRLGRDGRPMENLNSRLRSFQKPLNFSCTPGSFFLSWWGYRPRARAHAPTCMLWGTQQT